MTKEQTTILDQAQQIAELRAKLVNAAADAQILADARTSNTLAAERIKELEAQLAQREDMLDRMIAKPDPPKVGTCPVCRLTYLLKPNGGTEYHRAYNPFTGEYEAHKCPGSGDIPMEARTGLDYSCRDEQWKPGE